MCGERSKRCSNSMPAKLTRNCVLEMARCYGLHTADEMFSSKWYIRLVKWKHHKKTSTHPSDGILESAKDQMTMCKECGHPFTPQFQSADWSVRCQFVGESRELHFPIVFTPSGSFLEAGAQTISVSVTWSGYIDVVISACCSVEQQPCTSQ